MGLYKVHRLILPNSRSKHLQVFGLHVLNLAYNFLITVGCYHSLRHFRWINFIEPAHLQGVIKGLSISSLSSKQILQALPDSKAVPFYPAFRPPTRFLSLVPLKELNTKRDTYLILKAMESGEPPCKFSGNILAGFAESYSPGWWLKDISPSWKVVTLSPETILGLF